MDYRNLETDINGQQTFAIVEMKVEKYPYAEENDEYMPDFLRIYSESTEIDYDPQKDLKIDSWDGLVRQVYKQQGKQPPVPVRTLDELLAQEMDGPNGERVLIDGVDSYLYCYGLESSDLYWIREVPSYAAFCTSREKAAELISKNREHLRKPEIRTVLMDRLLIE